MVGVHCKNWKLPYFSVPRNPDQVSVLDDEDFFSLYFHLQWFWQHLGISCWGVFMAARSPVLFFCNLLYVAALK